MYIYTKLQEGTIPIPQDYGKRKSASFKQAMNPKDSVLEILAKTNQLNQEIELRKRTQK